MGAEMERERESWLQEESSKEESEWLSEMGVV